MVEPQTNVLSDADVGLIPKPLSDAEVGLVKPLSDADVGLAPKQNVSNLENATRAMGLNDKERYLYQLHLDNLNASNGGISDAHQPNAKNTLLQIDYQDEKTKRVYNIPSVYDGKVHTEDEAVAHAIKVGLDKFPDYATREEALNRYQGEDGQGGMHQFMAKDLHEFRPKEDASFWGRFGQAWTTAADTERNNSIASAFGREAGKPWEERLGLSPEMLEVINKHVPRFFFAQPGQTHFDNPLQALDELIANTAIGAAQIALRTGESLAKGVPAAAHEIATIYGASPRVAREVASFVEYKFTEIHDPTGVPHRLYVGSTKVKLAKPETYTTPTPVAPIEGGPNPQMLRSNAAQTGNPHVDAIVNSPTVKAVIDNAVIDREHTIPDLAGTSKRLNDPTVYIDRNVPTEQTAPRVSDPTQSVKFDPAEPFVVSETVAQHTAEFLKKKGMLEADAHMVAREVGEVSKEAWYQAHDIDQAAAEAAQAPWREKAALEVPEKVPLNLYDKPISPEMDAALERVAARPAALTPEQTTALADVQRRRTALERYKERLDSVESHKQGKTPEEHDAYLKERDEINDKLNALAEEEDKINPEGKRIREGGAPREAVTKEQLKDLQGGERFQLANGEVVEIVKRGDELQIVRGDRPPFTADKAYIADILQENKAVRLEAPKPPKVKLVKHEGAGIETDLYTIQNAAGEDIARIRIRVEGDTARVENIFQGVNPVLLEPGPERDAAMAAARNALGPATMREVLRQFQEQNPDIKRIVGERVSGARFEGEHVGRERGTEISVDLPGAVARAQQIIEDNAEALEPPTIDVDYARGLGVVGPPKEPLSNGRPREAAARAVGDVRRGEPPGGQPPADRPPGSPGEPPAPRNPWRERFEHFVSKLEVPDDVKTLIRNAATENNEFPQARSGEIPLAHVDAIAEAAGVDPKSINREGLGRLLQNDKQVRYAIQMMLETADQMTAAAKEHNARPTPESRIKLQEAILRRDMAVEQVVGLRAEWGRTGNVIQEFLATVKDQEGLTKFMEKQRAEGGGRGPRNADELDKLAKALENLPNTQANRLTNKLREPGAFDKFMWYYVNNLISGPFTHTKYVIANALYGAVEIGTTVVAGGVGAIARKLGREGGVRAEEAAGQAYGYVAGFADAIRGAAEAFRTGLQTPLPGEDILGIIPRRNKNVFFQQVQPKNALIANIYGIPMKGAAAIHSFFNFMGYRASIEAQAIRIARQEAGKNPAIDWQARRKDLAEFPNEAMMREAIEDGYKLTFINELGPANKALNNFLNTSKVGRLILPFTHIPVKVASAGLAYDPILGSLNPQVRADIMGRNGAVKQDKAIARMVIGSTAGAYIMSLYGSDTITGAGPVDKNDRDRWLLTHQPYSIKIGGEWYSYNRFGPVGVYLGLHANFADAIPYMAEGEIAKAATMLVHNTGRQLQDEVGMQGIANLQAMIDDPLHKGVRAGASMVAAGALPWSSMLRQTASALDPETREVKSFIDGLKYYIPGVRQTLPPRVDYLGRNQPNPQYGFDTWVPFASTVIGHKTATRDPVDLEMSALQVHPAPPRNSIGGVELPPALYADYATKSGAIVKSMLEALINRPGWYDLPQFARQDIFKKVIAQAHQSAATIYQAQMPELIRQGIDNKERLIRGEKPVKQLQAPVPVPPPAPQRHGRGAPMPVSPVPLGPTMEGEPMPAGRIGTRG